MDKLKLQNDILDVLDQNFSKSANGYYVGVKDIYKFFPHVAAGEFLSVIKAMIIAGVIWGVLPLVNSTEIRWEGKPVQLENAMLKADGGERRGKS